MTSRTFARALGSVAFALCTFAGGRAAADAAILEPFTGTTVSTAAWQTGGSACLTAGTASAATGVIAKCTAGAQPGGANGPLSTFPEAPGSGALRLTSNTGNDGGYALYTTPQTSAGGVQAIFTEYSYYAPTIAGALSASGDGLSLFFVDASGGLPSSAGPFGADLGYGKGGAGIANGYLGVGFDEAGNFSDAINAQSVAVRGKATAFTQVASQALGALGLLGTRIDTPAATKRGSATAIRWRVTLAGNHTIAVEADFGVTGTYATVIAPTSITAANGTGVPASFYIGVAASTVNGRDIHEITNFSVQSLAANYAMTNGPVGAPGATGSYDGAVAVGANNDFTERSFTQAGLITVYNAANPAANTAFTAAAGVAVPNQIANTGTLSDTYTLAATAPSGWTIQLYPDNGLGTPGTGAGTNGPSLTPLLGSIAGATSTGTLTVAAGASAYYWAELVSPAGVRSYTRFDAPIVATSTNLATVTNTTHDELYTGFVYTSKSLAVTATNCPAGQTVPALGVCPGGTLHYAIAYGNVAVPGSGTEPASAVLATRAGTLQIVEDGFAGTNNWGTFTNGLVAAPIDTNAASTFSYAGAQFVAGATNFTDTVGGATGTLAPGATGSVSFNLVVR